MEITGLFSREDYEIKDIQCPRCKQTDIDYESINLNAKEQTASLFCLNTKCWHHFQINVNIKIETRVIKQRYMVMTEVK